MYSKRCPPRGGRAAVEYANGAASVAAAELGADDYDDELTTDTWYDRVVDVAGAVVPDTGAGVGLDPQYCFVDDTKAYTTSDTARGLGLAALLVLSVFAMTVSFAGTAAHGNEQPAYNNSTGNQTETANPVEAEKHFLGEEEDPLEP